MTSETKRNKRHRDEMCVCDNCGVSFLWTIEEQHQMETEIETEMETEMETKADAPEFCPACRRLATPSGRERGVVKWYDGRKHYGFIVRQKEDEIFTHRSQLAERGRLHEGDLVEFTVTTGEKGLMAADVRVLARGEEMSKE